MHSLCVVVVVVVIVIVATAIVRGSPSECGPRACDDYKITRINKKQNVQYFELCTAFCVNYQDDKPETDWGIYMHLTLTRIRRNACCHHISLSLSLLSLSYWISFPLLDCVCKVVMHSTSHSLYSFSLCKHTYLPLLTLNTRCKQFRE